MGEETLRRRVEEIRRFNRFYTRQIKILNERYLRSQYSLAEARVIYELAKRGTATAPELSSELGLDGGYTSRILLRLRRRRLVETKPLGRDARLAVLSLSDEGQKTFDKLDGRARADIQALLEKLSEKDQAKLVGAMRAVERLLGHTGGGRRALSIRPPRTGEMGWVIERHAVLYRDEYGWDERFETLAAEMVADFLPNTGSSREACFIAELDGEPAGCAFIIERSRTSAELRLLLVEPQARGQGIGRALVDRCLAFAREAGYAKAAASVFSAMRGARRLFDRAGFRPVSKERRQSFGRRLMLETWERET